MAKFLRSETEIRSVAMPERADVIRNEMAAAVRLIGGGQDVVAKAANQRAARATGLPITTIESLRWRKVKRVPADVYVAVQEALARHAARQEALAHHEAMLTDLALSNAADVVRGADVPGIKGEPEPRRVAREGRPSRGSMDVE